MDDEKIKELAQKFADMAFADADISDYLTQEHKFDITNACIAFANFILETHCIVEKEQIYMRYGVANALMEQDHVHKEFYRGQSSVLESIFGKEFLGKEEK